MASSKKKKSSKKPAAKSKKKAAPAKASSKKAPAKKAAPKKKAGKPAPKAAAKKKPAAKKPAPKAAPKAASKAAPKAAKNLNTGDAWDNAAMAPKVAATTPVVRMSEPSMSPPHALHDHAGGLVSPVGDDEEVAERIHGGEEAVKDQDEDGDSGSPRLDDREDEDE